MVNQLLRRALPERIYSNLRAAYARLGRLLFLSAPSRNERRLIVFLTPGTNHPTGGALSIASLFQESRAMKHIHHAAVVLCTIPGDPSLLRYTWFKNRNYIADIKATMRR